MHIELESGEIDQILLFLRDKASKKSMLEKLREKSGEYSALEAERKKYNKKKPSEAMKDNKSFKWKPVKLSKAASNNFKTIGTSSSAGQSIEKCSSGEFMDSDELGDALSSLVSPMSAFKTGQYPQYYNTTNSEQASAVEMSFGSSSDGSNANCETKPKNAARRRKKLNEAEVSPTLGNKRRAGRPSKAEETSNPRNSLFASDYYIDNNFSSINETDRMRLDVLRDTMSSTPGIGADQATKPPRGKKKFMAQGYMDDAVNNASSKRGRPNKKSNMGPPTGTPSIGESHSVSFAMDNVDGKAKKSKSKVSVRKAKALTAMEKKNLVASGLTPEIDSIHLDSHEKMISSLHAFGTPNLFTSPFSRFTPGTGGSLQGIMSAKTPLSKCDKIVYQRSNEIISLVILTHCFHV